jgi:hypothetical protein
MHLITRLNDSNNRAVIAKLQSIKIESLRLGADTNQKTLAPHPGLVSESGLANSEKVATLLKSILVENASLDSLEIVTMILTVQARHWKFVGGYVVNNRWVQMVTPLMRDLAQQVGYAPLGVEEFQCNFYDICASSPQNEDFDSQLLTRIFKAGQARRPDVERTDEQTTRLAELTDGSKVDFFSTNCVSCHQSSNYRSHHLLHDPASSVVAGITPFVERKWVGYSPSSVINFGYDGKLPRIAIRTAFESGAAAKKTNSEIGTPDPGYRPASFEAFWTCVLSSDASSPNKNCFAK